jgi:hypothetical protein
LRRNSVLALCALVLAFGVFLLCSSEAQAQTAKPVRFGVNAGLNLGKIKYDPEVTLGTGESRKMRVAARFGGDVEYAVTPMISVDAGVLYSMKGEKDSFTEEEFGVPVKIDVTTKLNYLTIPVLVKVGFGEAAGPRPFVRVGPEVGILLSAKSKGSGSAGGVSANTEVDIKKYLKSTEFGLIGGAGVDIPLGATLTGVAEVGYELGLTDISKDVNELKATTANPTEKTRNLYFAVGVKF